MQSRNVLLLVATLVLAACAQMEPIDFPQSDEIPDGPGLFTGEDGEITIFRR